MGVLLIRVVYLYVYLGLGWQTSRLVYFTGNTISTPQETWSVPLGASTVTTIMPYSVHYSRSGGYARLEYTKGLLSRLRVRLGAGGGGGFSSSIVSMLGYSDDPNLALGVSVNAHRWQGRWCSAPVSIAVLYRSATCSLANKCAIQFHWHNINKNQHACKCSLYNPHNTQWLSQAPLCVFVAAGGGGGGGYHTYVAGDNAARGGGGMTGLDVNSRFQ